jgi:hypothetical protein
MGHVPHKVRDAAGQVDLRSTMTPVRTPNRGAKLGPGAKESSIDNGMGAGATEPIRGFRELKEHPVKSNSLSGEHNFQKCCRSYRQIVRSCIATKLAACLSASHVES